MEALQKAFAEGTRTMTLLAFEGDETRTYIVQLRSASPLEFYVSGNPNFRVGSRALLLTNNERAAVRAEIAIKRLTKIGTRHFVEATVQHSERIERRQHARIATDLPGFFRIANDRRRDGEGAFECRVLNLSAGGAFLRTDVLLPEGAVIRWRIDAGEAPLEGLGMVVRVDHELPGMGVEFVELLGETRFRMAESLERLAA